MDLVSRLPMGIIGAVIWFLEPSPHDPPSSAAIRGFYMIVPTRYSKLSVRRAVNARLKLAKDE